jgi:hypothetical protein
MNLLNVSRNLKLVVVFLSFLSPFKANIIDVDSLAEVALYIETTKSEKTVCALDIDLTLTRPAHPATDPANFIKHSGAFKRMLVEHRLDISDVICSTALVEL